MNFYKSSAMIMVVILIVCLTVVGVMISQSKDEVKYPPTLSECPDYYEKQDSGACKDVKELNNGFSGCALVDFNNEQIFTNKDNVGIGPHSAICEKKKWAMDCGVDWDGITNNENVCYSKSS